MKKCLLIACLTPFLLTACAFGLTEVEPAGTDTYSVTYSAGFKPQSWVEIKNVTLERADAFCVSRGMKMIKPVITSNKATGLIPKAATTRFQCVPPETDVTS